MVNVSHQIAWGGGVHFANKVDPAYNQKPERRGVNGGPTLAIHSVGLSRSTVFL